MDQQKIPNQTHHQKKALKIVLVLVVLVTGAFVVFQFVNHQLLSKRSVSETQPAMQMTEQALKDTTWDPRWLPLPNEDSPAQPLNQVRVMYAFAARHPEVLQYAPCYCGCESGGHKSVRDCFVKGQTSDGRPQWDGMGYI